MKRTLITSALPYANGYIHLGHAAGAYLPADIYARYSRLKGEDILYVCGSDEHGVAITISAEKEKVTPKHIIDKYHTANKAAFEAFGMSFDNYSRTSVESHHELAKEFFGDFLEKGYLVDREEEQFYDPKAKMFLPDRYVEGTCPNCGEDGARGDQCDKCGAYYNQIELKNPISTVSGGTPEVKKTTHWYFRFDMFQEFLEKYIEEKSKYWKDNVIQQTRSWLKQGLAERAITRDLDWGVKIKEIPGVDKQKAEGKVLYVWFDAVLGYISATKEYMKAQGRENDWKTWWQDDETRYLAFIGKDNIVFHTLIFPAMLHARGGYILPDNVPAHEFLNLEGEKFSKSRNWSIDLKDFVQNYSEKHYIDALRYTLATNFPETKDADFTWKDFQAKNNNELAAIFGNFVNRSLQFTHKNFDGKVPALPEKYASVPAKWDNLIDFMVANPDKEINKEDYTEFSDNDLTIIKALYHGVNKISNCYERFRFRDAMTETMNVARAANKYFNDEEPWKAVKDDAERAAKSLYFCVQLVHTLSIIFAPIVPYASQKISQILEVKSNTGEANNGQERRNLWDVAAYPTIEGGSPIRKPELIFTKIEDEFVEKEVEALKEAAARIEAAKAKAKELSEVIDFDDFLKVKLRTATIIEAEKVKKSKKLLKLQVKLGDEQRQVVAGIAEHYEPEYLVGKTVVMVANLKPAKIMGIESQGMILAANTDDGKLSFLSPEKAEIGSGAEVR